MYFLLGVSIAFAFLLMVNLLAAVSAAAVWRAAEAHTRGFSANTRSRLIFGLRTLPLVAALVFVAVFVIPAYVLYEPSSSDEVVGTKLALIAIASSIGVLLALFRVGRTWLITRRLTANWIRNATVVDIDAGNVPVYRFDHQFPVVAVVGIIRPRLFVADKVLRSLSENEFRAAIAHEIGHLAANDNLKRTLLRVCRDLLLFPIGIGLDRAWSESVESLADEYAARSGRGADALDLASALVKIAKLVPAGSRPGIPVGAFLVEENDADVTSRVRRLVRISDGQISADRPAILGSLPTSWLWSAGLITLVLMILIDSRLLASTHEAVESLVRILQ